MKILFFLSEFPRYSETFIVDQIVYFIRLGHEVSIVSIDRGDLEIANPAVTNYALLRRTRYLRPFDDHKGVVHRIRQIFLVAKNIWRRPVRSALRVERSSHSPALIPLIASQLHTPLHADVILAHFGYTAVVADQLCTIGLLQGKLVAVFHGADLSNRAILERNYSSYKTLFRRATLVLPVSNHWRAKLNKLGCVSNKLFVIRMGVDTMDFSFKMPMRRLSSDLPLRLLTVSRLVDKKGLRYAIAAVAAAARSGVLLEYEIVGSGPLYTQLAEQIRSLKAERYIRLVGALPRKCILSKLHQANVFLLPSVTAENGDQEGIPVALMEAMACGVLCISTYHSGIPELVEHAESGFLSPERDVESLSRHITMAAHQGSEIEEMLRKARLTVEVRFNKTVENKKLFKLLEEITTT